MSSSTCRPTCLLLLPSLGLLALGLAVSGFLWTEIGSVRTELREEIRENRAAIAQLAEGQARIEAILEERLPRDR